MDPYVDYAQLLVPMLAERYGARTVALYTDRERLRKNLRRAPQARVPHVSSSYLVVPDDLGPVIGGCAAYRIVAVLRRRLTCCRSRIADALGSGRTRSRSWSAATAASGPPASVPDGPRISVTRLVSSAADVRRHGRARPDASCKPNAGVSNRDVLYVDQATSDAELAAYFGGRTGWSSWRSTSPDRVRPGR
jgi:hypothetical protein